MNNLDKQYTDLLQDILDNGVKKETRNGGTLSVFGKQIRHKMSDGFPLLTTKKLHWKSIVSELLWFLQGRTDLKWLLEQGNTIWVGDAYKRFLTEAKLIKEGYESGDILGSQPHIDLMFSNPEELIILSQEQFIERIKTNDEFAKKWGELGPIYGKQWRSWKFTDKFTNGQQIAYVNGKVDQIANLINDLKTNPDSRRLMVNAWNV